MVVRMEGGNKEARMDTRDRKRWSGCEEVWRCTCFILIADLLITYLWTWDHGPVIESTGSFSKGPRLDSQHPCEEPL